ncbi:MAG: DNA repair exonuclease [Actinobacteria bacterium QS_8_72_14]|nr:MAG: DNA repair exonuclease [Actinobacteria bacterium QS_8_72_14]
MVRFLHTADWQLGMTRHYLAGEAEGRFRQGRIDAIAAMGRLAEQRGCAFAVVAGDVFDTNQVDRRTLLRAVEALNDFPVPVWLLPGNHDPLDAASVLASDAFADACADHIGVLAGREPVAGADGVELVGAPWTSKRPVCDLAGAAVADLEPAGDTVRVLVAHGGVDALAGDHRDPAAIRVDDLEAALAEGRDAQRCDVEAVSVGGWRFVELARRVDGPDDVAALAAELDALPGKERTAVRLELTGTLTLTQAGELEGVLADAADRLAALDRPARHDDLHVRPDDGDFSELALAGYAAATRDRLAQLAETGGEQAETAVDALALLLRLSQRSNPEATP